LKIENIDIDKIIPYENNPRINGKAVDKVVMSLKEYGWQQPIVIDKNKIVIAGHTRLKAAKRLGLKTCPVIVAENLTEAQVKAYRIADNKTGELATWDMDLLEVEINDLIKMGSDIELTGFSLDEIFKSPPPKKDHIDTLSPSATIAEKIKKTDKVIYQFSGGRDSTLAILKTLELVRDKSPVACYIDTGTEFPDLLYFIYDFCKTYELPLEVLHPKNNFFDLYGHKKVFPDPVFRDCIGLLINNPLDDIFFKYDNALIIRGGRSKQKTSRSKSNVYQEIVINKTKTRKLLNPLFELTNEEYDKDIKNIKIWPGYGEGFIRTACWCCPFQRKPQWDALKDKYPFLWDAMLEMVKTWEFKKIKGDGCIKQFFKYWDKWI